MAQGSNFHVEVRGCRDLLKPALCLALADHSRIEGFKHVPPLQATIHDGGGDLDRLILFWCVSRETPDASRFPAPLKPEMLVPIVEQWLDSVDYGREPDHDGDNHRGFYLTNGDKWCHITGQGHYACLDIRPQWMMFGK